MTPPETAPNGDQDRVTTTAARRRPDGPRIGWFNTAEAAGRAADRLAPSHPNSVLVISQTGPHGQWVLRADGKAND